MARAARARRLQALSARPQALLQRRRRPQRQRQRPRRCLKIPWGIWQRHAAPQSPQQRPRPQPVSIPLTTMCRQGHFARNKMPMHSAPNWPCWAGRRASMSASRVVAPCFACASAPSSSALMPSNSRRSSMAPGWSPPWCVCSAELFLSRSSPTAEPSQEPFE